VVVNEVEIILLAESKAIPSPKFKRKASPTTVVLLRISSIMPYEILLLSDPIVT
jgi:hypothetical protein